MCESATNKWKVNVLIPKDRPLLHDTSMFDLVFRKPQHLERQFPELLLIGFIICIILHPHCARYKGLVTCKLAILQVFAILAFPFLRHRRDYSCSRPLLWAFHELDDHWVSRPPVHDFFGYMLL
jgi:hypothetical protein